MAESKFVVRARLEDAGVDRQGAGLLDLGHALAEHVGDDVGVDVIARQGRHLQDASGRRRQPDDAAFDGVAHGDGDARRGVAVAGQQGELPGEDRVTAGSPVDLADGGRRDRSGDGGDEGGDGVQLEPAELDVFGGGGQIGEAGAGEARQLIRSVAADEAHRSGPGRPGDEVEQDQGRLVRPLQVVEHDHDRGDGGELIEPSTHRVEQQPPLARRSLDRRPLAQGGDDRGEELGVLAGEPARPRWTEGVGEVVERP